MLRRPIEFPPVNLQPHPFAKVIRLITDSEYEALRSDIAACGQMDSIMLYQNQILDGRHRHRACLALGLEPLYEELLGNDDEAKAYVLSQNAHRRHLTSTERSELLVKELLCNAGRSDRLIASTVGVSPNTVKAKRQRLEATAQIAQLKKRSGKDGKVRKAPNRSDPHNAKAPNASSLGCDALVEAIDRGRTLLKELIDLLHGLEPADGRKCLQALTVEFTDFRRSYMQFKEAKGALKIFEPLPPARADMPVGWRG